MDFMETRNARFHGVCIGGPHDRKKLSHWQTNFDMEFRPPVKTQEEADRLGDKRLTGTYRWHTINDAESYVGYWRWSALTKDDVMAVLLRSYAGEK